MECRRNMSKFEKTLRTLIINAFYRKFTLNKKIRAENIYNFFLYKLGHYWLQKPPMLSHIRKKLIPFYTKLRRTKKNEEIQRIQKKYPDLKVAEAYFYWTIKDNRKLKQEDFEVFEVFEQILDILTDGKMLEKE